MRITNERNLPYALVKAVENDSYNMGSADKSVTGLLQPPRQSALRELHADEVTEDASDQNSIVKVKNKKKKIKNINKKKKI